MQKVLQRTAHAKAQAVRRALKRSQKNAADIRLRDRKTQSPLGNEMADEIRAARRVRREDRSLGPLAPRRDVGELQHTYGTMSPQRLQGFLKPVEKRAEAQPIVAGDRVVLVEGRDQGRIGRVISVDKKRHECTVQGLNLVDIAVPDWAMANEADKTPIRTMEAAVPLPSVRLIHKLEDPETGTIRDVVVQKIELRDVWHDRHLGIHRRTRIIPGLEEQVPWPRKEPREEPEHDIDTLRLDVEAQTWVPTLLTPPMPTSVIDELRNKYSQFRDRHDEDFVAKKTAEDEAERNKRKSLQEAATTPLQEAKRRERQERKARGFPELTPDMLAKIGEVMARNRRSIKGGETEGASVSIA
ncbi:MAG: hypothetical protein M1823_006191 [Watsoniomyces obsoletus]|nr:MAG: hypothetical protein M1823_006191 [Watsoniomyces obsoletus]